MNLEKKLQVKYGKELYQRNFSKDFREAVKGVDYISKIVSKVSKDAKEQDKE